MMESAIQETVDKYAVNTTKSVVRMDVRGLIPIAEMECDDSEVDESEVEDVQGEVDKHIDSEEICQKMRVFFKPLAELDIRKDERTIMEIQRKTVGFCKLRDTRTLHRDSFETKDGLLKVYAAVRVPSLVICVSGVCKKDVEKQALDLVKGVLENAKATSGLDFRFKASMIEKYDFSY